MIKFLLLAFLTGCSFHSDVQFKKNKIVIPAKDFTIEDVKAIDWVVGKNEGVKISKGMQLTVRFPNISRGDFSKIISMVKADAWLIEVEKQSDQLYQVGKVVFPIATLASNDPNVFELGNRLEEGIFQIQYAGVVLNPLGTYPCPTMNHNKKIGSFELQNRYELSEEMEVGSSFEEQIGSAPERPSIQAVAFVGGMSLIGEYYVKVSLFNTITNSKVGSTVTLAKKLVIDSEYEKTIMGCNSSERPDTNSFNSPSQIKFKM